MKKKPTKQTHERRTISLPKHLMETAVRRAAKIRPYTVSNYVATLIEQDVAAAK